MIADILNSEKVEYTFTQAELLKKSAIVGVISIDKASQVCFPKLMVI